MAFDEDIDMIEDPDMQPEAMPEDNGMLIEHVAAMGVDLAFELEDSKLDQIAQRCLEAYKRDREERAEWEEAFDKIMKLVKAKRESKSFPWPGASNVKYPLIMKAGLKFGARAYPAIVNGTDVVKPATVGNDPEGQKRARGDRVATHMNYQLLLDMPEWNTDTRRLCYSLPYQGTMFRQAVWDAEYSRPLTTLISGKDFVVTQAAKDLETVPHFAKEFPLFIHQIKERQNKGIYRDVDLGMDAPEDSEKAGSQDMLECHCRYDMDGDGYDEPWIAIIHKQSEKLLSLKAGFWPKGVERDEEGEVISIRRHVEFTKYGFLPDPEGNFYDIGYGQLLLEDSEVINTLLNQLIDAATDQNLGGGFLGQGVTGLEGGSLDFRRGEWKFVNMPGDQLRNNMVPRPTSQPSPVLFNLLSLLIESSKDVTSDQDVMSGNVPANTPATTVLASIEEAQKVYNAIYKGIFDSLTEEFELISQLNAAYLPVEAYQNVLDEPGGQDEMGMPVGPNPQQDYGQADRDIVPVADPSMTTSAQKMSRAQFLMQVGAGNPMFDQREIMRRVLEAAAIDDIESLMPPPGPEQQQQQAQQMQVQLRAAMAEIMGNEASATEDMMSARLKRIEGDTKIQDMIINAAAMRMSLLNMMQPMGGMYAPQAFGPGMGGMAGFPPAPAGAGVLQGPGPQGGPPAQGMGAGPMGVPNAGPVAAQPSGDPNGIPDLSGAGPAGPIQ
jgi:chaperonin GroES